MSHKLNERLAKLSPKQRQLMRQKLQQQQRTNRQDNQAQLIAPVSREQSLPLSFAQQRLWLLAQMEHGNRAHYNEVAAYQMDGKLQVTTLQKSLTTLIARHEILRTTFSTVNEVLVQLIKPPFTVALPVIDLQTLPQRAQPAHVRRLITDFTQQPFELEQLPLLRFVLLQQTPDSYVLFMVIHHIIWDGWSGGVFIQEFSRLYEAFSEGQTSPLPPLSIQYADFAHWQRQWLTKERVDEQLNYWKPQLADAPALLQLPTDYPRPSVQSFWGHSQRWQINTELTHALQQFSQQSGSTLFMTLLAAFATLLFRYSGRSDLVIGSPIANRTFSQLESLIGFFVNTLVLRLNLAGNPVFWELLQRVKQVALDAYAHQDCPFESVVEALRPERNLSHTPLFQVMFVLQNAPLGTIELPGLTLTPIVPDNAQAKFDLTLSMAETAQGLTGTLEYNTDLFAHATIGRMIGHFQTLLEGIVDNPQLISDLPLLTPAEYQQLQAWNDTATDYPQNQCIHQLFEAQVERTPEALAVVFENQQLTYQELNTKANQLAHYLRETWQVGPDVLVGICVERSLEMVIGLFGILKANGAYLPLDPTYPPARLRFMLADAQVRVLLTQQKLVEPLATTETPLFCLDTDWDQLSRESTDNLDNRLTLENLAYVIYTSGSTGKPKGTLLLHKGLINYLTWATQAYQVANGQGAPVQSSIGFDATITSLYLPLLVGQQVVLLPEDNEIEELTAALSKQPHFSLVKLTPAHLDILSQLLSPTQLAEQTNALIIGGEALTESQIAFWRTHAPETRLMNEYGPTEAVVGCCVYEVPAAAKLSHSVPIGRPIANTQLYVLDAALQPTPIGIPGELYIGGTGLARGYLNRPELTMAKFIPNPFGDEPNSRLYKTGDLARYLANGNLEYLGRIDNQVKIRGFGIELSEIEAVLVQHPMVRETVVLNQAVQANDQRLLAYIVPALETPQDDAWHAVTAEQLSQWADVFEDSYHQSSADNAILNFAGWNSSYTGLAIPDVEMQEWVNATVNTLLSLQPQHVLEIGCGTGLLLFRIAPHCQHYWATDFSATVLQQVAQTKQRLANLDHVTLFNRPAADFSDIAPASVDTIILNSVIQYFPNISYLLNVLEQAIRTVKSGGHIFIGDIRSLPLLKAYHTSVQFFQAPDALTCAELQQRVQQRIALEEELVIDPNFFLALKQHNPQLSHVRLLPKRGSYQNELTKFRYDVILQIDNTASQPKLEKIYGRIGKHRLLP